jgi:hypothetical protein
MSPKKKATKAIGSSGAVPPVPVPTGGEGVVGAGRGAVREHPQHSGGQDLASAVVRAWNDELRIAKSKAGVVSPAGGTGPSKGDAVPPTGGAVTSKMLTPTPAARSPQVARDG